jgi:hypothetical protein
MNFFCLLGAFLVGKLVEGTVELSSDVSDIFCKMKFNCAFCIISRLK